jgi:uncharacterized membrane protein
MRSRTVDTDVAMLSQIFAVSGTLHLVKPGIYEPIVPDILPAHRGIVLVSGVAELACAAGLLYSRTRRRAGWASAALLLAVFPSNIKMATDAWASGSRFRRYATIARLPLQLPLLRMAWKAAPRQSSGHQSNIAR